MNETAVAKYEAMSAVESFDERQRISELDAACERIKDSPDGVMTAFARESRMLGIPQGTVKRLYYRWRSGGSAALADGRKRSRGECENKFFRDFKTFAENDKNGCKGGYAEMMRQFRGGAIFSFGTWRDVWRDEFKYEEVPEFCPANWTPHGASYENLMWHYAHDSSRKISLAWNRQGQFAASKYVLSVLRSRVGLHVGEIYQADDVWHNIDVYAPFAKGVFQPLEFAIYDVASAFKAGSLMKPRLRLVDEKTGKEKYDNLKEFQFRCLVAHMMCTIGFYKGGVTLIGERGTTRLPDAVLKRVASVPGWGKLFRFQTSGIMNSPAHNGLLIGNAGGNPRMKSLCECAHNILHNATASLPGNRGRDAEHLHESQRALVKYSTALIETARKIDPTLVSMLDLPILSWGAYTQYFKILEDEVMDRKDHQLEGWSGREVIDYRLSATSGDWLPIESLNDMSPEQATAIKALLATAPDKLMRQRKMSRREAWKSGRKDLVRWPLIEMPAFLDPAKDMRTATVRADGTIMFTDKLYYPGERKWYLAEYQDRRGMAHRLAPGDEVKFFWNPCGELSRQIWIADDEGNVLGMAPALKTAAWVDPESIDAAMGQRVHQIASLMADTKARHADSHVARLAAQNINRALIASAKDASGRGPVPNGEGSFSLEELNAAGVEEPRTDNEGDKAGNDDAIDFLGKMNSIF